MSLTHYAFDIETDTKGGHGLDPNLGGITTAALTVGEGRAKVFDIDSEGSERNVLEALVKELDSLPAGIIDTWNGAVFDFPFVQTRARLLGVTIPLEMLYDASIPVKYAPTPGYAGGYRVRWGKHAHIDIQGAFRTQAEEAGIAWSLKPVGRLYGFDPIEVERDKMHLLTREEERAYGASDVILTRSLALLAQAEGFLPEPDQL